MWKTSSQNSELWRYKYNTIENAIRDMYQYIIEYQRRRRKRRRRRADSTKYTNKHNKPYICIERDYLHWRSCN